MSSKIKKSLTSQLKSLYQKIKDILYDFSVFLHGKRKRVIRKVSIKGQKRYNLIFVIIVMTLPLLLQIFNLIYINGKSLFLAFQKFDYATGQYTFYGLENFKKVINDVTRDPVIVDAFKRTLVIYVIAHLVTSIVPLLFAFYIYKKYPMYKFFRVILFIPSIVSGIIVVTIYKLLVDRVIPDLAYEWFSKEIFGLLSNPKTTLSSIVFFFLWCQISNVLTTIAAMNSVEESCIEAGKIDGVKLYQELLYIIIPNIYDIWIVGFIFGWMFVFTTDLGLYGFYGTSADSRLWTLGYFFTIHSLKATSADYPYLTAWGWLLTLLIGTLTYFRKWWVYKLSPTRD